MAQANGGGTGHNLGYTDHFRVGGHTVPLFRSAETVLPQIQEAMGRQSNYLLSIFIYLFIYYRYSFYSRHIRRKH